MNKAKKLRELFRRNGIIRVMGAHSAMGAKLAENAGFDCVWSSGLEISTSFGVPDANILTMTDFLNCAISMNESVSIPIVADCDTGFGNSNNVIHMVKKYEAAGIAAVSIEDKHFPKVNSFVPGRQELAPLSEFVGKILAAKNAQTGKDFMVIARVEALIAGWGVSEAVKRANAYAQAGADAILIHSKSNTDKEIKEFIRRWKNKAPLVVVPTTYFRVTVRQLEKMNVKMVIYANHGIRAAIRSMQKTFREIMKHGSTSIVENNIASMKEVFDIQGMHKMKEDEKIFSESAKDGIVAIIPAAGDHLEEHSMKDISNDIPISMLDINGKPLLQKQLETLNRCRVYDVNVIAGYKQDKITVPGVKVINNDLYRETGVLYSIMEALDKVNQRAFIIYGDVLFDHIILQRMAESRKDITILLDKTWDSKDYGPEKKVDFVVTDGKSRKARRLLSADSLKLVRRIGSRIDREEAIGEFPGMTFLSPKGVKIFKEVYKKNRRRFKKASLADFLSEVVDSGFDVFCMEADSGWMEIHSMEDYKLACSLLKKFI
ncbi:MAG: phosphoenolpyruvate mutase [Candidatus Omnitrophota bacterium]